MRVLLALAIVLGLAAVLAGCAANRMKGPRMRHDRSATGFVNKTMDVGGVERRYVVYVPQEYRPERKWPLIMFLHGMGERGDDGLLQTEVGIGRAIRRHPDWFSCLVVMPQCPDDALWAKATDHIDAALGKTCDEYNVDPERIYLTGLSMGGFGTWAYGAQRVDVFAALMPICGGGRTEDAEALAKIPIRVFHGADDKKVLPALSRAMVEAVERAGGDIEYTEFPGVEHNSWDPAYDHRANIKWLLRQHKKP